MNTNYLHSDAGLGVGRVTGCAGRAELPSTAGQRPIFFFGSRFSTQSKPSARPRWDSHLFKSPQRHQGRYLLRPEQILTGQPDAPRL